MNLYKFIKVQLTKDSPLWILPLVVTLIYCGCLVLFNPNLSWSMFDEVAYYARYNNGWTVKSHVEWDWANQGRFRPLIFLQTSIYYQIFGSDIVHLRWARFAEFLVFVALCIGWLRVSLKLPWVFIAFGMGLILKSNPIFELIEVWSLAELQALNMFFLASLTPAVFKSAHRAGVVRILALIAMALTKEPMGLLAPIVYAVEKNKKATIVALCCGFGYVVAIRLSLHGGYGGLTYDTQAALRALYGFLGSLRPLLFVAVAAVPAYIAQKKLLNSKMQSALRPDFDTLLIATIALLYSYALAGKAPDYTYHYAPAVVLFVALGVRALSRVSQNNSTKKSTERSVSSAMYLVMLGFILLHLRWVPIRLEQMFQKHALRNEVRAALVVHIPQNETVATNVALDWHGLGYLAGKKEDIGCAQVGFSFAACCKKSKYIYYTREGYDYDRLRLELKSVGTVLKEGDGYIVGVCP